MIEVEVYLGNAFKREDMLKFHYTTKLNWKKA